jgi:hypothetical protein
MYLFSVALWFWSLWVAIVATRHFQERAEETPDIDKVD